MSELCKFWLDWSVQVLVAIGTLAVALAAVFADAIKSRFVDLAVSVDSSCGNYQPFRKALMLGNQVVATSDSNLDARYFRLRVRNGCAWFPAHNVYVWLLRIDRYENDAPQTWTGEIPLIWQHKDFLPGPRTIGDDPAIADLFSATAEGVLTLQVMVPAFGLPTVFRGACELWVTVQARSDERSSPETRFRVKWDGALARDDQEMAPHIDFELA